MHDAGLEAAESVTKKIIAQMASYSFQVPGSKKHIKLGITAGISVYPLHARNAGDLLRAADSALYDAKKHNRGSFNVAKGITGPLGAVTVMKRRSEHEEPL
jgi:diguanylate cyclase (GGDEF)-like protein